MERDMTLVLLAFLTASLLKLLFIMGVVLIFFGILIILMGFLTRARGRGNVQVEGGGLILVGPIPIIFGSSRRAFEVMLVIFVLIVMFVLIFGYLLPVLVIR